MEEYKKVMNLIKSYQNILEITL